MCTLIISRGEITNYINYEKLLVSHNNGRISYAAIRSHIQYIDLLICFICCWVHRAISSWFEKHLAYGEFGPRGLKNINAHFLSCDTISTFLVCVLALGKKHCFKLRQKLFIFFFFLGLSLKAVYNDNLPVYLK